MKMYMFSEDDEMIRVEAKLYTLIRTNRENPRHGTYDTQVEVTVVPVNYDDCVIFFKHTLNEINFVIYDSDENDNAIYLNQPEVDYQDGVIVLTKVKTNFF